MQLVDATNLDVAQILWFSHYWSDAENEVAHHVLPTLCTIVIG